MSDINSLPDDVFSIILNHVASTNPQTAVSVGTCNRFPLIPTLHVSLISVCSVARVCSKWKDEVYSNQSLWMEFARDQWTFVNQRVAVKDWREYFARRFGITNVICWNTSRL
jgi:hypothetical protein